jgi:y4mF family transcriptional regulator
MFGMTQDPHDRADSAKDLSSAVRRRRKEFRLRQADLAALAGCSTRFVEQVEAGKPSLRLDKLLDVLGVLGLELVVRPGSTGVTVEDG